ncbi:hypothetical protein AB0942_07365 [Streptomyces nodosus]|uniref:hypothetical protein n=1 Tax=Streptomyces nodosus TaxID=40318 RepID=UPI0034545931
MVIFAAGAAARICKVSGCRVGDVDPTWCGVRHTRPGRLTDKGTKGTPTRKVAVDHGGYQLPYDRALNIRMIDTPHALRAPEPSKYPTSLSGRLDLNLRPLDSQE